MEEYKLYREITRSTLLIEGDKIYVSNYGNVKLNDEVLTLGHGLRIGDNNQLCISGIKQPIYHIVYELFKGELPYDGKGTYNIHHIDYNRLNNSVDNLMLCTATEHGKIHSNDQSSSLIDYLIQQQIKYSQLEKQYNQQSVDWLRKRKRKRIDERNKKHKEQVEQNKRIRILEREQKKIEKQKQIQELIDTGQAYYNENGKLVRVSVIEAMHSNLANYKRIMTVKQNGVHKGQTPWNKGLTKETDERVAKNAQSVSKAMINRKK